MLTWDKQFSVNHPELDQDHLKLSTVLSTLHSAVKQEKGIYILKALLADLERYAYDHCSREEKYLLSINHPDFQSHRQQHELFFNKIEDINSNFLLGNMNTAAEMLSFLNDWFMTHIFKVDISYKV